MGFLVPLVALLSSGGLIASIVGIGLSVGLSWVANKLLAPKQQKTGGTELDLRIDPDVPHSIIFGRAVTAGSLVYAESYGKRGDIDNSDLIEIIALAEHPCAGLVEVYVEGERPTTGTPDATRGTPLVGGYASKLWYRFFDGSQSAADAYTVSKLDDHSKRPWTAEMVGRGVTYARLQSIYDGKRVAGRLRWYFVLDGIRLYDPRKDSSVVGGSGAHRFGTLSTHEHSSNLAVVLYNILRGIRVADSAGAPRHFYGLENTPAANLPLDVWFAAMNECDVVIDGEPQYHGGAEVMLDVEPWDTVRELLKSCDGRLSEIGGVYKLYVGAPGVPVMSITDGDLAAQQGDGFRPVLPLEQRVNYVTASYTNPAEAWNTKIAPPRGDSAAEAADGRRVTADIQAPWVQSGSHAQRLQKQMLAKAQRQRRHIIPLGPKHWGLEPGDVIAWNSTRNGYVAKLFEIDQVEDDHAFNSTVSMTEVDPEDYDWSPGVDLMPEITVSAAGIFPDPKPVDAFALQGISVSGGSGTARPAIRVTWDNPDDLDADRMEVQYRTAAAPADVSSAHSDAPTDEMLVILAGIQPATAYEVRGRFVSKEGYPADWTGWLAVTTPDVRLAEADLDAAMNAQLEQLDRNSEVSLAAAIVERDAAIDRLSHTVMGLVAGLGQQTEEIVVGVGARITQTSLEISNEAQSRAEQITTLTARLNAPTTGLAGIAIAANTLTARVTAAEGVNTSQATSITSLTSRITGAEGVNSTQATAITALQTLTTAQGSTLTSQASSITSLTSRVTAAEGVNTTQGSAITALQTLTTSQGNSITSNASAITALDTRLTSAEGVNSSQATALSGLDTRLTSAEGVNSSQGTSITSLTSRVTTAENNISSNGSAISSLQSTSSSQGTTISSHTSSITSINSSITSLNNTTASQATSITSLNSSVTSINGSITSLSASLTSVFASNAFGNATAMFQAEAQATPTGVASRVALKTKTEAGSYGASSAAMYLDSVAGLGSRVEFIADRMVFRTSAGVTPVFDVSGSTIALNANVQINGNLVVGGTITADKIVTNSITQFKTLKSAGGQTADVGSSGTELTIGSIVVLVTAQTVGVECHAILNGYHFRRDSVDSQVELRFKHLGITLGKTVFKWDATSNEQKESIFMTAFAPVAKTDMGDNDAVGSDNYTVTLTLYKEGGYVAWGTSVDTGTELDIAPAVPILFSVKAPK